MSSEVLIPQATLGNSEEGHGLTATDSDIAISVRNLGKMYYLYDRPQDRLKQAFLWGRKHLYREFWALRDVSFEVKKGETVGIIGRNGAGKSTLLQIIAGTLKPTTGQVEVKGQVAALLELGSGFNPEFTGRENVFLNGAILGLSREKIERQFDEIVDFADIGDFIDQPVKLYSSGMMMRLAFAINACINPDILIVDETLSVGDMYFQAKCMARIARLRRQGVSILFVSHALQTVKSLCDRALFLDKGQAIAFGSVERVADLYSSSSLYERETEVNSLSSSQAHTASSELAASKDYISMVQPPFLERITERTGKGDAQYYECCVFQDGEEVNTVVNGRDCQVMAWLEHKTDMNVIAEVGILVRNLDGLELFAINSYFSGKLYLPKKKGDKTQIVFGFPVTLAPDIYTITLGIKVPQQGEYWDKVFNAAVFRVVTKDGEYVPGLFKHEGTIEYYKV